MERWYGLFSAGRFQAESASAVLVRESLAHVGREEVYVVAGDGTQTPRSSASWKGRAGCVACERRLQGGDPRGTALVQWQLAAAGAQGYSRAVPIRRLPAFTEKSAPVAHARCKEWEAARDFLVWLKAQLRAEGRAGQALLMVADGGFDTLELWKQLPAGVTLLVRSAKNRVLYSLPGLQVGRGRRRKYGARALTPQEVWQQHQGWRALTLTVRGRKRYLQVKVRGLFLREGARTAR